MVLQTGSSDNYSAELLENWWRENSECRGGVMPEAQGSCDRREALGQMLEVAGWCYGEDAEFGYQADWGPCKALSTPNGLTSAEQTKANQLAAAYARDRLIQAEVDRQLRESERAQIQRDLEALRRIP